jgi:UDP-N-acetylglucosamine 1-carboxyvinyltransferase
MVYRPLSKELFMDKIVIHGGKKLKGTVKISGSKNSALPILAASLLTDEECVVRNVPELRDIDSIISLLTYLGKRVSRKKDVVRIYANGFLKDHAPYELVRKMRASVLVMGPLLARRGLAKVSLPGGCAIGARPIDIHLFGFERLGAKIDIKEGYVVAKSPKLSATVIPFRFPSVGATENLMLASALVRGKTIIENAAREPEIADLAEVLNKMGAKVTGAGASRIVISGVDKLSGFEHNVIPDRVEASTYLIAAAITKGDLTLKCANLEHLSAVVNKLKQAGMSIKRSGKDGLRAKWVRPLKPVKIKTAVYPGFPTDAQAQWMALMSLVQGRSVIEESVFENRFLHVAELKRFGADLQIDDRKVKVRGVESLSGAPVMVSDLRAGAALVLAGLAAEGKTEVLRVYHLDRGYERLESKLRKLGAKIHRISC